MKNNPMAWSAGTLLLLLSSIGSFVQAQEKLWVVRASPLTLLQPNYPALHIGVEYKISAHWSFLADYGFKTPDILFKGNEQKSGIRQYKGRAEARYYLNGFFNRMYVATEFFYIAKSFNKTDGWYSSPEGSFSYTSAHVKTDELGAFVKVGHNKKINLGLRNVLEDKILLDLFVGIGLRWVWVKYFPVDATPSTGVYSYGAYTTPIDQIEGHFLKPNFIIGARLGYIIAKK